MTTLAFKPEDRWAKIKSFQSFWHHSSLCLFSLSKQFDSISPPEKNLKFDCCIVYVIILSMEHYMTTLLEGPRYDVGFGFDYFITYYFPKYS